MAPDAVAVLLGDKWADTVPLISWLAANGVMFAIAHMAGIFLAASGRARTNALLIWVHLAAMAIGMVIAVSIGGILPIIVGRTIVTALYVPLIFFFVIRADFITVPQFFAAIWRRSQRASL